LHALNQEKEMSAKIQFGYEKSETGEVSVVAKMITEFTTETELAYARQGMLYVHQLLDSDLEDLGIPFDLDGKWATIVLTSGRSADDDDFDEIDAQKAAMDEDMHMAVTLEVDTSFDEIGCLNQAHRVVAKAAYEMIAEAIRTVKV
jgi:hypothetical protein